MPNQDYPGVCLSCSTDSCEVVAPDISAVRERVKGNPLSGYTRNVVNNLTTAMGDKFADEHEAYMAFDVMKAAIVMGLKNGQTVDLTGLGVFKVNVANGTKTVSFEPDPNLNAAIRE